MTTRAWLLMLPLLAVMIAVIGWPLADTVGLSFTDAKLVGTSGNFVGIDNYVKTLTSANFQRTLTTTTIFAVVIRVCRDGSGRSGGPSAQSPILRPHRACGR